MGGNTLCVLYVLFLCLAIITFSIVIVVKTQLQKVIYISSTLSYSPPLLRRSTFIQPFGIEKQQTHPSAGVATCLVHNSAPTKTGRAKHKQILSTDMCLNSSGCFSLFCHFSIVCFNVFLCARGPQSYTFFENTFRNVWVTVPAIPEHHHHFGHVRIRHPYPQSKCDPTVPP